MTTHKIVTNKPRFIITPGLSFVHVDNSTGKRITSLRYVFRPAGATKFVSIKLASSLAIGASGTFELIDNSFFPVEARIEYWIGLKKISSPIDPVIYPNFYVREHYFNVPLVYKPNTFYSLMQSCALPGSVKGKYIKMPKKLNLGATEYSRLLQWHCFLPEQRSNKTLSKYNVGNEWLFDIIILDKISDLTLFAISQDGVKHTIETKQSFTGNLGLCLFALPLSISPITSVKIQWQYEGKTCAASLKAETSFLWAAFLITGDTGGSIWSKEQD